MANNSYTIIYYLCHNDLFNDYLCIFSTAYIELNQNKYAYYIIYEYDKQNKQHIILFIIPTY